MWTTSTHHYCQQTKKTYGVTSPDIFEKWNVIIGVLRVPMKILPNGDCLARTTGLTLGASYLLTERLRYGPHVALSRTNGHDKLPELRWVQSGHDVVETKETRPKLDNNNIKSPFCSIHAGCPATPQLSHLGLPQVVGNQPSAKPRTSSAPVADKQRSSFKRATPDDLAPATRSPPDLGCWIIFRTVVVFPVFDAYTTEYWDLNRYLFIVKGNLNQIHYSGPANIGQDSSTGPDTPVATSTLRRNFPARDRTW
ncbi:hypothetical protein F9C07_2102604 [Aspergillus flavus]|uniref:Uncharacterized protein n=1 Tax=Aspergillus flavus (strain ATCC 200026 / FGSC A1120 / IAM 13836 / NRRL 3357 / JCM 12722 / SRRC 167) TaxID=332952 RepID=A0A7U2MS32_ASPFN|nr:hypothetical protein F9C07_2102604 [Aspergillus flavus]